MLKPLPGWMYAAIATTTLIGVVSAPPMQLATSGETSVGPAAPPVSAGSALVPAPAIAFDAVTPIVMDRRDAEGNPSTTVILKNEDSRPQKASLSLFLLDNEGAALEVSGLPEQEIPFGRLYPVAVTLRLKQNAKGTTTVDNGWRAKLPVHGYLVLKTVGLSAPPVVRELRVTPEHPSTDADRIVILSLVFAALSVGIGILGSSRKLRGPMGSPSWSDSWGSNTTLGASLLTVLVGLVVFPEQTRFLPKTTYAVLSTVFPALVGLSPVIFGLVRTPQLRNGTVIEFRGFVGMFCLAAVFTLWGALGQLGTLFYAILELRATPAFPPALSALMLAIAAGLLGGLFLYGLVSVRQILDAANPSPPVKTVEKKPPAEATAGAAGGQLDARVVIPAPMPALHWPLL